METTHMHLLQNHSCEEEEERWYEEEVSKSWSALSTFFKLPQNSSKIPAQSQLSKILEIKTYTVVHDSASLTHHSWLH